MPEEDPGFGLIAANNARVINNRRCSVCGFDSSPYNLHRVRAGLIGCRSYLAKRDGTFKEGLRWRTLRQVRHELLDTGI